MQLLDGSEILVGRRKWRRQRRVGTGQDWRRRRQNKERDRPETSAKRKQTKTEEAACCCQCTVAARKRINIMRRRREKEEGIVKTIFSYAKNFLMQKILFDEGLIIF
jgi:hypothetical protein